MNIGGKATLIRWRGGEICRGKWFSRSEFSFVPKCLNGFVRDCSFLYFVSTCSFNIPYFEYRNLKVKFCCHYCDVIFPPNPVKVNIRFYAILGAMSTISTQFDYYNR